MKNREKTVEKRTQQDYTMAFKLGIVSRVEKGELLGLLLTILLVAFTIRSLSLICRVLVLIV